MPEIIISVYIPKLCVIFAYMYFTSDYKTIFFFFFLFSGVLKKTPVDWMNKFRVWSKVSFFSAASFCFNQEDGTAPINLVSLYN